MMMEPPAASPGARAGAGNYGVAVGTPPPQRRSAGNALSGPSWDSVLLGKPHQHGSDVGMIGSPTAHSEPNRRNSVPRPPARQEREVLSDWGVKVGPVSLVRT